MEFSKSCSSHHVPVMVVLALMSLMMLLLPANGQTINNPCTPAMLTTFTPCFNFLTNSSANATSPSPACCNALKNLTSSSMGCTCLIVTGSVPFQLPINRTLAVSLPRACNMPSVPLQCNAPRGAPIPASGIDMSSLSSTQTLPWSFTIFKPPKSHCAGTDTICRGA
ncbi:hypothetical protein GOBAR_DD33742 [Gossypium barbadense]|nr:hypothetical protein GOBAR_DD33742 [Gossypium barbadense]